MAKLNEKWDRKLAKLRETYPAAQNINWGEILRQEPDVFFSVVNGVTKPKGQAKSKMSVSDGNQKMARINNMDYSELDFCSALDVLCKGHSVRVAAKIVGYPHMTFYKLKTGEAEPSYLQMKEIAVAFNRDPSYFLEYRIGRILTSVDAYLKVNPETAIVWYSKILSNQGIKV